MTRRRSPPRRGGSSDAARTLVPRWALDSGRAMPYAARQGGGKGTIQTGLEAVKDGCPNAGLGVVGGKGLRKPLIPCPISAVDARKAPSSPNGHGPFGPPFGRPPGGDQARMPGSSRKPAAKRKGSLPHRKTTTVTPGGWGEATGQRQKKRVARRRERTKKAEKEERNFPTQGKAECKRADSPGTARGRN